MNQGQTPEPLLWIIWTLCCGGAALFSFGLLMLIRRR